jgi:hypothetical protein
MTEMDGSFDYSGLPPGSYTVRLSSSQLDRLHMTAQPLIIPFTLTAAKEGDMISGIKFILLPQPGKIATEDKP